MPRLTCKITASHNLVAALRTLSAWDFHGPGGVVPAIKGMPAPGAPTLVSEAAAVPQTTALTAAA